MDDATLFAQPLFDARACVPCQFDEHARCTASLHPAGLACSCDARDHLEYA